MVAMKDVVVGTFYKGTRAPAAGALPEKAFFLVTDVTNVNGTVSVDGWWVYRKTGAQWHFGSLTIGSVNAMSPFRRSVTAGEVTGDGFLLPPVSSGTRPKATSSPNVVTPKPTGVPSKRTAPRKDGTTREKVEGNETSPTCQRCGRRTETVLLFMWSTQFCPDCE